MNLTRRAFLGGAAALAFAGQPLVRLVLESRTETESRLSRAVLFDEDGEIMAETTLDFAPEIGDSFQVEFPPVEREGVPAGVLIVGTHEAPRVLKLYGQKRYLHPPDIAFYQYNGDEP